MSKISKHFTIDEKAIEYLKKVKEENSLSSLSLALELVVREHKKKSRVKVEDTAKFMAKEIGKVLKDDVSKFKVSARETDKNVQVLIEMLNGFFIKSNVGDIVTTTGLATGVAIESSGFKIAKEEINKRLHRNRIVKANKTNE